MSARLLPDLMVFLEVVRAGSLTGAATKLHTVQSNVTARIKKLEQTLGATLLERHARGVKPTPAGEQAFAIASRLDSTLDELNSTFQIRASARPTRLRLGAIETVAASHLPPIVAAFSREHARVDVSVQTGSSASLLKQLRRGELDAVFVSRPATAPGLSSRHAFRDELAIVAPSAVRSLQTLLRSPGELAVVVQRLGCSYTERLLDFLETRSRRKRRMLEAGTLENVVSLVAAGVGIAALPRAFATTRRAAGPFRFIALPAGIRYVDTYLVAPATPDRSRGATAHFVDYLSARPPAG